MEHIADRNSSAVRENNRKVGMSKSASKEHKNKRKMLNPMKTEENRTWKKFINKIRIKHFVLNENSINKTLD